LTARTAVLPSSLDKLPFRAVRSQVNDAMFLGPKKRDPVSPSASFLGH